MDLFFEILMAVIVLAIVLRAAWQGNPGPSYFVAVLGAICAVLFMVQNNAQGDAVIACVLAAAAGLVALLARRAGKGERQAE